MYGMINPRALFVFMMCLLVAAAGSMLIMDAYSYYNSETHDLGANTLGLNLLMLSNSN